VDAVVYLVDAYDKERFAESKKELDALLSDESLATVPFLILGNKIDIPYAASEDELLYHMGLTGLTTGKGKVNMENTGVRPIEVFMCSIVRKMGYGDGFKWVDAVVYLVDAYDKERFAESKKELDALLSDESLATVPFLILGNKIDIPYAASEDELLYHMGLTGLTTGKGKVNMENTGVRPIEVFMCSIVRKMGYGDGFKWVSQYIK
ncbi:hypothetical protein M8C21_012882, partial [Ambrosia artemisiifolia]